MEILSHRGTEPQRSMDITPWDSEFSVPLWQIPLTWV